MSDADPGSPSHDSSPESSRIASHGKPRRLMVIGLAAVFLVVCVAGFFWHRTRQDAREQEAKAAIAALNGLPVLDANQKHVVSLNLQLIKDESAIQKVAQLVAQLPHLQILDFSGTPVSDDDLAVVSSLHKLNSLHLNGTRVTDGCLRHIAPLRQLQGLHLGSTAVTDQCLAQIVQLKNLKHLDLSGTSVGPGLSQLAGMKNLTWLLLRDIPIEPPTQAAIAKLIKLERLTVRDPNVQSALQESLSEQLPNLSID